MTFAEWLLLVTELIGRNFNNATLMREHSQAEDMVTGNLALWFILACVVIISVCLAGLLHIKKKE